jgi:hypothetical protein
MNIVTYNPKQTLKPEFAFFVLSKGLNAGRCMKHSCPNCFMVSADSKTELMKLYNYAYLLWKSNKFSMFLVGSVIPFLRIQDFKKVLFETMNNPNLDHSKVRFVFSIVVSLKRRQEDFNSKIIQLRKIEKAYIREHIKL